ncbi:hypothetical protein KBY55_02655 [Streptomyces sp. b94]|uniref:hypothetical protein n=1 Tax=Streptomyces sp. b94 TaxID=1827634 RepID=UPI001B35E9EE|nr:hypothetical protein [Streptomyces sp. b94]MBQ1095027.1 hypothetical protein [Streptomyces sp. b94]
MTTTLRTAFTAARARRTARHLAGVSFCDSCVRVGDSATRAAGRRQHTQLTALTQAR